MELRLLEAVPCPLDFAISLNGDEGMELERGERNLMSMLLMNLLFVMFFIHNRTVAGSMFNGNFSRQLKYHLRSTFHQQWGS